MPMEDVIGLMRASIEVETIRDDAFIVRYIGRDPRKVMEVTNRLASLYVDESVADRQAQAEGTDDFLESQLIQVKGRLEDTEKRLEAYRKEHALELPSQLESNLQQVRNAQQQTQAAGEQIARLQDRQQTERQTLAQLEASPDTGEAAPTGSATTAQQLAAAETQLRELLAKGYKAGHPDVDAATRAVRDLRTKLAGEAAANASVGGPALSPVETARRRRLDELRGEIADLDHQIAKARSDQDAYRQAGEIAQKRVDALPTRDSELTELMRDYSTMDSTYKSLLSKKEDSQISSNLEQQQIGEQYKLLDAAQLPERPFSPDRPRLTSEAAAAGLLVGLALVGFLEYRDRSFRNDQDVTAVMSVPVLASVPLMRSAAEQRRRLLTRVAVDVGCGGLVAACLALVVYTLAR